MSIWKILALLLVALPLACSSTARERIIVTTDEHQCGAYTKTWAGFHATKDHGFIVITAVCEGQAIIDDERHLAAFLQIKRNSDSQEFVVVDGWVGITGQDTALGDALVVHDGKGQLAINEDRVILSSSLKLSECRPTERPGGYTGTKSAHVDLQSIGLKMATRTQLTSLLPDPGGPMDRAVRTWRSELTTPFPISDSDRR